MVNLLILSMAKIRRLYIHCSLETSNHPLHGKQGVFISSHSLRSLNQFCKFYVNVSLLFMTCIYFVNSYFIVKSPCTTIKGISLCFYRKRRDGLRLKEFKVNIGEVKVISVELFSNLCE